jgi:peptidoglycan/xylan/chitin deacetylase (PgdA/CDA1 family)
MHDKVVFDGQQCSVSEMIREMDRRGWEIGLHPSWYSYNDLNELKRQKAALEKALGKQVVSIRQHQLHFDIRVTPYVHAKAEFLYDSTIGFNDNLGFRFGTSYPRQLQDVDRGDSLSVVEIPLVIQDGAMLGKTKGMRLDEDTAFAYITQITANVERVGGVLTLLWHPNVITDTVSWNLYARTLAYLEAKKAWFGNIRQVGEKWKDLFSA